MSSFFFYIYILHIESVDIHSWQIRKNWFQNRNRSLCELCIQGAICEKHTCRVVFCSILYISLFCIFFLFLLSFRLSVLPEFVFAFRSSLFRSPTVFPSVFPANFIFIWTVVHLIGCTGLLGTDNWLANNSSNNIRAYDIQVLIYTLHRYFFFVFVFRSNHIVGACPVSVCECTCLSLIYVQTCAEMFPNAACSVTFRNFSPLGLFFFLSVVDICRN